MADDGKELLTFNLSTRVSEAMMMDLEDIALRQERKVSDVMRLALGAYIRQRKAKTGAKVKR